MSNVNSKPEWYLAEFPYLVKGKKYHYKSRISAKCLDDAHQKVEFDLEVEGVDLDSEYFRDELVIKIRKIPTQ